MQEVKGRSRNASNAEKVLPTGKDLGGASNLFGLVLCGGQSIRMGSDKGLILKDGIPWSRIVAGQIEKLNIPVYISVNPSQAISYQSIFPQEKLIIDTVEKQGPLTGLLSANKTFPDKDFLLVACDMINIKQEIFFVLITEYLNNANFDFFAFDNAGTIEPLCAVYTGKAISEIFNTPASGLKYGGSLRRILEAGNTKRLTPVNKSSFKNYNRKSDVKS